MRQPLVDEDRESVSELPQLALVSLIGRKPRIVNERVVAFEKREPHRLQALFRLRGRLVRKESARASPTKASKRSSALKKMTPLRSPSGFGRSFVSTSAMTPSVPSLPMKRSIASMPGATK